MSIEAARKAVQGEVLSTDEIEKIIAAFAGDRVLYAECERCSGSGLGPKDSYCPSCSSSGIVQVYPEETTKEKT